jgi:putative transcriptional regulator
MDWAAFDALTEEEIMTAALADPDAQPLTEEQLSRMRRVSFAKHVRFKLGLSQDEFARRFGIPIGTLRDWEQHRTEPDTAALSYLKVIKANPKAVTKALAAAE